MNLSSDITPKWKLYDISKELKMKNKSGGD